MSLQKVPHIKARGDQTGWNLSSDIWKDLQTILDGMNFVKVNFDEFSIRTVTAKSGVYILCSYAPLPPKMNIARQIYNVLYVGQAQNLRARLSDHFSGRNSHIKSDSAAFKGSGLSFWYIQVPIDRLNEFENRIQAAFNPVINRISAPKLRGKLEAGVAANPERVL
jgi:hypothetical protein